MESLGAEKFGGYNAHFLQELSDEYECPVCKMALREPVVTECGHRFCYSCSEEITKRNNCKFICPFDKSILNSKQIYPDKFTERKVLQFYVKCDNFLKSCQWTGELKKLNNHLTSCEYQEVKCLNEQCSATLLRKELSYHMEKHCIYRLVTCRYCEQKITFCNNQSHEENCECLPLCCVNQCGMKILRKEMSFHITESCANTIIPCQYLNIGCKFKGMRKDQKTHANSSTQDHLSMAISKLVFLENKILTYENETTKKLSVLEKEMGQDQDEFKKSSKEEMSTKLNAQEDKINSLAKKMGQDQDEFKKSSKEEMSTKLNAQEDKINSLAKKMEHLNKRAPEPTTVSLNEPTDASKLTRPVLEEEKPLGFRELLKQTNERCRPK